MTYRIEKVGSLKIPTLFDGEKDCGSLVSWRNLDDGISLTISGGSGLSHPVLTPDNCDLAAVRPFLKSLTTEWVHPPI